MSGPVSIIDASVYNAELLPSRILEARTRRGWSQSELAFIAGIGQPYISLLEAGEREPTIHALIKLADALQVSTDWLLGCEPEAREFSRLINSSNVKWETEYDAAKRRTRNKRATKHKPVASDDSG